MWKAVKKHGPKSKKLEGHSWAIPSPYGPAWWLQSGSGKKGFLLGLHGGGEGAGSAGSATSTGRVQAASRASGTIGSRRTKAIHGKGKARERTPGDRLMTRAAR